MHSSNANKQTEVHPGISNTLSEISADAVGGGKCWWILVTRATGKQSIIISFQRRVHPVDADTVFVPVDFNSDLVNNNHQIAFSRSAILRTLCRTDSPPPQQLVKSLKKGISLRSQAPKACARSRKLHPLFSAPDPDNYGRRRSSYSQVSTITEYLYTFASNELLATHDIIFICIIFINQSINR